MACTAVDAIATESNILADGRNLRAALNHESVLTQTSSPSAVHQEPALPLHLVFQL